jgi:hypothetical protein
MMYSLPSLAAWTRVRFQTNYCGDSVASCTFTVPATTAGRLLVVAMMYDGDTVNVSSASGAGTWTHPSSCKGSFSGGSGVDWIYNLSSTSGATSITVNLSATASFVDYWYYEYTGTAPFTFDVCGVNNGSSSTSAPAGSITTSGANGLAIAGVKGDQNFAASTAVTATGSNPWTSPTTLVSAFEAMAEALNFAATTTNRCLRFPCDELRRKHNRLPGLSNWWRWWWHWYASQTGICHVASHRWWSYWRR